MKSIAPLVCPEELANVLRCAYRTQEKTRDEAIKRHTLSREDVDYCCIVVAQAQMDYLRKELNLALQAVDAKAGAR